MKITVLGSNGWFESPTGATTCLLVQLPGLDLVFDAGSGFSRLSEHISGENPLWVLLSHLHYDHLYGFHTLPRLHLKQGMTIFGLPETNRMLNRFFDPAFTAPLQSLPFPVTVSSIGHLEHRDPPLNLRTEPLVHNVPCLGYRLEVGGTSLAFCTDTGWSPNLVNLAKGVDLFFCEASLPPRRRDQSPISAPDPRTGCPRGTGSRGKDAGIAPF